MKSFIAYIFIALFLAGFFQPTIYDLLKLSDTTLVFSVIDISETNEEKKNSKDKSEFSDGLDDFFHNQSLLSFSSSNATLFFSDRFPVSDFTDIFIPPPKV